MWVKDISDEWTVIQLDGDAYALSGGPLDPVHWRVRTDNGHAYIIRHKSSEKEVWLTLTTPRDRRLRINGMRPSLGIRVLRDRDEIRVDGERLFFSSERLAAPEPFPGADQAIMCPRCKQEIIDNSTAIKCPQCGVWHHQSEEFPCWTYSERCALCDQSSSLDSGYRWTPEGL